MPEIHLKEIPTELYNYILEMQLKEKKAKKVGQYSQAATVFKIIKEHKDRAK